jgi:hypothetical protein
MSRPALEVADIVRAAGNRFWEHHGSHLAWQHRKVLDAIVRCRTAALGAHRDQCNSLRLSVHLVQLVPYGAFFLMVSAIRDLIAKRSFEGCWEVQTHHNIGDLLLLWCGHYRHITEGEHHDREIRFCSQNAQAFARLR